SRADRGEVLDRIAGLQRLEVRIGGRLRLDRSLKEDDLAAVGQVREEQRCEEREHGAASCVMQPPRIIRHPGNPGYTQRRCPARWSPGPPASSAPISSTSCSRKAGASPPSSAAAATSAGWKGSRSSGSTTRPPRSRPATCCSMWPA